MDPRLLDAYNRELTYLREMGREFAQEYPKVAAKLSLDNVDLPDPHVERLIESFAFLSARITLQQEEEFPKFTQHLLDMIYPDYLQPTPSTAIVEIESDTNDSALAGGIVLPRGSVLTTTYQKGMRTHCEFQTTMETTLWPIKIIDATFSPFIPKFVEERVSRASLAGSLRLTLEVGAGLKFNQLPIKDLKLFLASDDVIASRIYEHLLARVCGVVVPNGSVEISTVCDAIKITPMGLNDNEALFPCNTRSFPGHRLIKEYFVLPQKFRFLSLDGLNVAFARIDSARCDIYFLLNRIQDELISTVDASNFRLNCTPVVNLFHHHCDRVFVSEKQREFHIIPDKTRTSDFEIIQINRVTGIDTQQGNEVVFQPFFSSPLGSMAKGQPSAYYASQRQKRTLSQSETLREKRVSYAGSEVFLSIVDHESLPFSPHLRQLSVEALCSNRDLPLFIKRGVFDTDLSLQEAPVKTTVRFLIEPTVPRPSLAEGIVSWRLINLLSLNYLSMIDAEPEVAANAIRQFLRLYVTSGDDVALRQIDAVRRLSFRRVVRRVPLSGPLVYAQGVEARLTLDESLFEGGGGFMFGKVLEVLFSQMSTINSFVETVVESLQRGEIKRWPARLGNSPLI